MLRAHHDGFDPRDLAAAGVSAGGHRGRPRRGPPGGASGSRSPTACWPTWWTCAGPPGPPRRSSSGASPRGATGLLNAAKAYAWLSGRGYVTPDDVKAVARPGAAPPGPAAARGRDRGRHGRRRAGLVARHRPDAPANDHLARARPCSLVLGTAALVVCVGDRDRAVAAARASVLGWSLLLVLARLADRRAGRRGDAAPVRARPGAAGRLGDGRAARDQRRRCARCAALVRDAWVPSAGAGRPYAHAARRRPRRDRDGRDRADPDPARRPAGGPGHRPLVRAVRPGLPPDLAPPGRQPDSTVDAAGAARVPVPPAAAGEARPAARHRRPGRHPRPGPGQRVRLAARVRDRRRPALHRLAGQRPARARGGQAVAAGTGPPGALRHRHRPHQRRPHRHGRGPAQPRDRRRAPAGHRHRRRPAAGQPGRPRRRPGRPAGRRHARPTPTSSASSKRALPTAARRAGARCSRRWSRPTSAGSSPRCSRLERKRALVVLFTTPRPGRARRGPAAGAAAGSSPATRWSWPPCTTRRSRRSPPARGDAGRAAHRGRRRARAWPSCAGSGPR